MPIPVSSWISVGPGRGSAPVISAGRRVFHAVTHPQMGTLMMLECLKQGLSGLGNGICDIIPGHCVWGLLSGLRNR